MNKQVILQPLLEKALLELDLAADSFQCSQLLTYLEQLQKWNKTYNLTAIKDPKEMLVHHLFDSLSIVHLLTNKIGTEQKTLYDIGSGAGLPGIVLAIMQKNWQVHCVDAVEKKTAFIRQMKSVLQLSNLTSHHARIEQLKSIKADLIVSRAFASLHDFVTLSGEHLSEQGVMVAMKGKLPEQEIQELHATTDWQVTTIENLTVPYLNERCLVWIQRVEGNQ